MKLTRESVSALAEKVKRRELDEEVWSLLEALLLKVITILTLLEGKGVDLERFAHTLPGYRRRRKAAPEASDSSPSSPEGASDPDAAAEREPRRRKGHGRRKASDYKASETIFRAHSTLRAGDSCSTCTSGVLYRFRIVAQIKLFGQQMIKAVQYQREVLRCRACGLTFTASLPSGERDQKYDASVAAVLAVARYAMGLPFHRMAGLLRSAGIWLAPSVQYARVLELAMTLRPVFKLLRKQAADARLLYVDDTTGRVLEIAKENEGKGKKERTGIFTTGIVAEGPHRIVLFATGSRHAGENLERVLANRREGLDPPLQMCDGLSRNTSARFTTIMCNCTAHAVRKFRDIEEAFPGECRHVLEAFREVYRIDEETNTMTPEERLGHHQKESGPIMAALKEWMEGYEERGVEPNSVLGKDYRYVLTRWEKMTRFLQVAGAVLDNNLVERTLKMVIRHRRNSLFYKTRKGAYTGDLLMSVIRTCQENGIDPIAYLTAVGEAESEVRMDPAAWLPWAWAARVAAEAEVIQAA